MSFNTFIFSEKKSTRIKRHILFWILWWLYFGAMHAAKPFLKPESSFFLRSEFAYAETALMLIPQMIVAYLILFFVLPMYTQKGEIVQPIFWGIVSWFACGALNLFMIQKMNPVILDWLLTDEQMSNTERLPETTFYMAIMSTWKGALSGTAFVVGIHYIKQWYLKEQRNLQLQKENTDAQLQLLTAQVHPHFLFNSLNNIYSQALNESPKSSKMIMSLSDLLRYILYEGRKPLVPLDKEIQMVIEYINLEKIRYGNKLDLHYLIADKTKDIYIAPLLLLPLIENCFKHGASKVLVNPWINLTIEIKEVTLVMKLMNGKTNTNRLIPNTNGIGLTNVRQRLELLYKDRYELQIREEDDSFIVDLKVQLVKDPALQSNVTSTTPEISYA